LSVLSNARQKLDPLDLEIVERVYEVGCAYFAARDLCEDATKHAEKEATLRKTVFAIAGTGQLDFDTLCDSVIAQIEKIRTMAKAAVASA
jgi:hypothetical protein